jgi:hypothetical protein
MTLEARRVTKSAKVEDLTLLYHQTIFSDQVSLSAH